jgi:hypothetical protein
MPNLKHKGECQIQLGTLTLDLCYKTNNFWALTEITGKTPHQLFKRFEGMNQEDAEEVAASMCDFSFVVPLIMAGLADDPQFRKTSMENLRRKICKLLDAEAEKRKVPVFHLVGILGMEIMPAVLGSMTVETPEQETESPNEQAPEANA